MMYGVVYSLSNIFLKGDIIEADNMCNLPSHTLHNNVALVLTARNVNFVMCLPQKHVKHVNFSTFYLTFFFTALLAAISFLSWLQLTLIQLFCSQTCLLCVKDRENVHIFLPEASQKGNGSMDEVRWSMVIENCAL